MRFKKIKVYDDKYCHGECQWLSQGECYLFEDQDGSPITLENEDGRNERCKQCIKNERHIGGFMTKDEAREVIMKIRYCLDEHCEIPDCLKSWVYLTLMIEIDRESSGIKDLNKYIAEYNHTTEGSC